ncbi:cytochrome c oxidase subunit II [Cupriavidus pauculus]|jgi:cytochrome c oxidase subunit 2|uniref:cytochrome c oxidase subunit II n=1 Tax=Cupriavidus pauculus TaxID=82633 RepID=UPI00124546CA|nr:cytochrome c oxidase subunit II [Cupriavidus pauculus]KAB0603402.1 cytochrome c oxidase subunit II [Cupriavidus pauculus]MCM3605883.1 cytochrome c oxidase subunit II [Cupriavidus pauculus]UAL02160.1 cytochrome c oxidase subunit II [Cupriavidus pauculus]
MAIAIALVIIVAASVLFHFLSPWWATPLASNWKQMDDTLTITLVITGVFFVVINLFVAYIVWRFRHREGHRAAYEPENARLERWLIGLSTVGIMALLAPGLIVYADYVHPPPGAMQMEVVGQQWQWAFRFPGKSGQLGTTDARFVNASNPLGLNPDDPRGQDNVIVVGPEVHLPLNRPVKVLLRSKDVLHDFYVPPIRARMNMVPGMVTSFWFTPTQAGKFDILCAQLCGVGHYNMRGYVIVEEQAAFDSWLAKQQTFAVAMAKAAQPAAADASTGGDLAAQGRALAQSKGCAACHSVDGGASVGPTWKGLFGSTQAFTDGSSATVDDAFLKREIEDPQARIVKGFGPVMPKLPVTDAEVAALTAYIHSLGSGTAAAPQGGK